MRQNPRVSKDRKSVRMLESLIRLTVANARLYLRNRASLFDAITVIILVEHTLFSCLFGLEPTPAVLFSDERDYQKVRDMVLERLELNPKDFIKEKQGKRDRTPSPIKRMANSHSVDYS